MPNPFEWSAEMDGLYWNSVVRDVLDDPRTIDSENLKLGYPFEKIREEVLVKGRTDFSQGHDDPRYGHLTADDKVLLYCFVNLRMHFFAALATFEAHRALLEDLLPQKAVGCCSILDVAQALPPWRSRTCCRGGAFPTWGSTWSHRCMPRHSPFGKRRKRGD